MMKKYLLSSSLLLSALLSQSLSAQSMNFETFLNTALTKSPYLKSSELTIKQAHMQGNQLTRYKNPALELEYSSFDGTNTNRESGYRVAYAQPIRLWGVSSDKEALKGAMSDVAQSSYTQKKSSFVRDISLAYAHYTEQKQLEALALEELKIAKIIYDISSARYKVGTIARGVMLQSRVAYEMVGINSETQSLRSKNSYFGLLKMAGITEELSIQANFHFTSQVNTAANNPTLLLLESQAKKSSAKAEVNANKIEWMTLIAEYESEPDQDIARVGVNIPLAFFNTKVEEKTIANLQSEKSKLLMKNSSVQLKIMLSQLESEKESLHRLQGQNEKILESEIELLAMFQEGYKIANTKLLELQDIKNRLISTKESLIKIQKALDVNAIQTNYIQGTYND